MLKKLKLATIDINESLKAQAQLEAKSELVKKNITRSIEKTLLTHVCCADQVARPLSA